MIPRSSVSLDHPSQFFFIHLDLDFVCALFGFSFRSPLLPLGSIYLHQLDTDSSHSWKTFSIDNGSYIEKVQMFGSVLTNSESFFPATKFNIQPFKLFRSKEDTSFSSSSSSTKMGQTASRPKAMSISGRTTQLVGRIRRASSHSTAPVIKGSSISMVRKNSEIMLIFFS